MLVGEINSSLVLAVHNLQPGIGYSFTVTAENEAGEGLPSAPSSVVTIPEERKLSLLGQLILQAGTATVNALAPQH